MKRILIYLVCVLVSFKGYSQTEWVSASIDNGTTPNSTGLYIKTVFEFDANKCDNIVFTVRVPKTAGANVTVSESFHAPSIAHISFAIQKLNVDDGTYYYYLVNGTGTVLAAPGTVYPINTPQRLLELTYAGGTTNGVVELANIENDIPGNIYIRPQFYIQIDQGDITNYTEMFYGTGGAIPVNNEPGSGNDFVGTVSSVVLPVKFMSFTADKKQNNALLSWSVQNESVNTDHYEIERSFNGVDFTVIGTAAAKNNGQTSNTYTSTDFNLTTLRSSGKIYYRIKQVDKDGRFVTTAIKFVNLDDKVFEVSVYPNPVVASGTVQINIADAGKINISLLNAAGQKINSAVINGISGLNTYTLNMSRLASGSYVLKVENGSESRTIPVVKK
jgi:hypothetical protein